MFKNYFIYIIKIFYLKFMSGEFDRLDLDNLDGLNNEAGGENDNISNNANLNNDIPLITDEYAESNINISNQQLTTDIQDEEERAKQAKIKKEQMMAFVKALHRSIKEVFLKWPLEDVEAYIHNMHRDRKLQQEHVFKLQQQQQHQQQRILEDTNAVLRVENTEQLNTLGGSESESQEVQSESETSEEYAGAQVKKGKKNQKPKHVVNKNNEPENNDDQKGNKKVLAHHLKLKNMILNLNKTYDNHILKPDSIMHKNKNNNQEIKSNLNLNQLFSEIYDPQYIHIIDKQVSTHVEEL